MDKTQMFAPSGKDQQDFIIGVRLSQRASLNDVSYPGKRRTRVA